MENDSMKPNTVFWLVSTAALLSAAAAPAQQVASNQPAPANDSTPAAASTGKSTAGSASTMRTIKTQYFRPTDKRGIDMFETPKVAGAPFTGFNLDFGGAFTQ